MNLKRTRLTCGSFLAGATIILGGCVSYTDDTSLITSSWDSGNIMGAAQAATARASQKAKGKDALIYRLEEGTTLRYAGDFEASNQAFEEAEAIVEKYDRQADVKLGSEAGALLTNLAQLPYRGRAYDKIMMNTYKALNYLQLGDSDSARVEFNRALEQQREAVRRNAKELEAVQEEAQKKAAQPDGYDTNRALSDPDVNARIQAELAEVRRLATYTDYVNPYSVYLDGLYFTYHSTGGSDYERALKSLERVRAMSPEAASVIDADLERLDALYNGRNPGEPVVYVIFETGKSLVRGEFKLDLPLFLVTNDIDYFGIALPTLEPQGNYIPSLEVVCGNGAVHRTATLCSMDSVIATDFQNSWDYVVTKTILASSTKAIASRLARDAVDNDNTVALLMSIATTIYQASVNNADRRTWMTLPKEVAVTSFNRPKDGVITLRPMAAGGATHEVELDSAAMVQVVLVRSINPYTPLIVQQFRLL